MFSALLPCLPSLSSLVSLDDFLSWLPVAGAAVLSTQFATLYDFPSWRFLAAALSAKLVLS